MGYFSNELGIPYSWASVHLRQPRFFGPLRYGERNGLKTLGLWRWPRWGVWRHKSSLMENCMYRYYHHKYKVHNIRNINYTIYQVSTAALHIETNMIKLLMYYSINTWIISLTQYIVSVWLKPDFWFVSPIFHINPGFPCVPHIATNWFWLHCKFDVPVR